MTTEHEPVFDAAEFTRMGRDIFCQRCVRMLRDKGGDKKYSVEGNSKVAGERHNMESGALIRECYKNTKINADIRAVWRTG